VSRDPQSDESHLAHVPRERARARASTSSSASTAAALEMMSARVLDRPRSVRGRPGGAHDAGKKEQKMKKRGGPLFSDPPRDEKAVFNLATPTTARVALRTAP